MRKWMVLFGLLVIFIFSLKSYAIDFRFNLKKNSLTSAGIFSSEGKLIKTLWSMKELNKGEHTEIWDGKNKYGESVSPGIYELKVAINESIYKNILPIGNSGESNKLQHTPSYMCSVAVGNNGDVYTANGWDEEGQDFKAFSPEGKTLFGANYEIRNGNPNGAPYTIAVDNSYIYCGIQGWANPQWKEKTQIQRFNINNGKPAPWSLLKSTDGHIQLYQWPSKQIPPSTPKEDKKLMSQGITGLSVYKNEIFACDALKNKIRIFNKKTGEKINSFSVILPQAIAIDSNGEIWVGHQHKYVSVFSQNGNLLATPIKNLGNVVSICFNTQGNLYVADNKADNIKIYKVINLGQEIHCKLIKIFGEKAVGGDYQPNQFYELKGAAVDNADNIIVIQTFPTGGARITKFSKSGKILWDKLGLFFTDTGNYAPWAPDNFITQKFFLLHLNRKSESWKFRGYILNGKSSYINAQHGVMRILRIKGNQFIVQCYGDGIQVYRKIGTTYKLESMLGGHSPNSKGIWNSKEPSGQWSWVNKNTNLKDKTIKKFFWYKKTGNYFLFGMNIDKKGNIIYCDYSNPDTNGIWEIPPKIYKNGNLYYLWSDKKLIAPPVSMDKTSVQFSPVIANKNKEGIIYAIGKSGYWGHNGLWKGGRMSGAIWMGGWVLAKFNNKGIREWAIKLPHTCDGLDLIPGNKGVMVGAYNGQIYHVIPEGLIIGMFKPGKASGDITGWLDNNSSLVVERDLKDGWLDVFTEDDLLSRCLWYRVKNKYKILMVKRFIQ